MKAKNQQEKIPGEKIDVSKYEIAGFGPFEEIKETSARTIALLIVGVFCVGIICCFLFLFFGDFFLKEDLGFRDALAVFQAFSGVILGPLGFVLGYYFKAEGPS